MTGLRKEDSRAWAGDNSREFSSTRYDSNDNFAVHEHTPKNKGRRNPRSFDDDNPINGRHHFGLDSELDSKSSSNQSEEKIPSIPGYKFPIRQRTLSLKSNSTYSLVKLDKTEKLRRRHSVFTEPTSNVEIREICCTFNPKRLGTKSEKDNSEEEIKENQTTSRYISKISTRGKLKVFQKIHEKPGFDEKVDVGSFSHCPTEQRREISTISGQSVGEKATIEKEEAETSESQIDENLSGIQVVTKRGKDNKELFIRRSKNPPPSEDSKLQRKSRHNYSLEKIDMDVLVGSLSSATREGMRNRSNALSKAEFIGDSERKDKKKSKSDVGPTTAISGRRKKVSVALFVIFRNE